MGRKKANARGTLLVSETGDSSSQVPPKSSQKRPYNSTLFVTAIGREKKATCDFGPGTSSEKVLHRPTNLKNISPINIDIGFKPFGVRGNGKDAISTSGLQQMRENKEKQSGSKLVKPPSS